MAPRRDWRRHGGLPGRGDGAAAGASSRKKTVYQTRTVYRNVGGHPPRLSDLLDLRPDPLPVYVYHYYDDLWPYRYFTGVWDFRYYHVGFRPHYHRFGVYHGPHYDTGIWRDRYRADRRRYRHGRDAHAWKLDHAGDARPRARYDDLKRSNVRLRTFHDQGATATATPAPAARPDSARERYEQAKRTHPRLRQFHRNRSASGERAAGGVRSRRYGRATAKR